jgi:hypothetical protein
MYVMMGRTIVSDTNATMEESRGSGYLGGRWWVGLGGGWRRHEGEGVQVANTLWAYAARGREEEASVRRLTSP